MKGSFSIGRSPECNLTIVDSEVSKVHCVITEESDTYFLEDRNSTNGTFLNGVRLVEKQALHSGDVIRTGRAILVFHQSAAKMLRPKAPSRFGLVGSFHTAGLTDELKQAAHSSRHVLLAGPSGSGKELAARALAALYGQAGSPLNLLAHNTARFSSEEEAASTLFGVAPRVFSNVDARPGLIELAKEGVLFLDEIHNLPGRVQRTLLRTIEDGNYARIGETLTRTTAVRFVFASNQAPPDYGLAHDLLARLRVVRILPLSERVADIPEIFTAVLNDVLRQRGLSSPAVFQELGSAHYEAMCLDGFGENNVRGIIDIADRIASMLSSGYPAGQAVGDVFSERFGRGPVGRRQEKRRARLPLSLFKRASRDEDQSSSKYESNKQRIIAAYLECNGNLSATERVLKSDGIHCNRKWLGYFIKEKWAVEAPKKKRPTR